MYKDLSPKEVLAVIKEKNIQFVDLRFMDFPGLQQHFTFPVSQIDEEVFESGIGFDGSSIRGWQSIHESDMLVLPDSRTAFIDPFSDIPTLVIYCNILDPITKERYSRDPRNVAQKAENYLISTGLADTCYIGPEAEFFIFDNIRYDQTSNSGYYFIDSEEGIWNSGRDENPNLGYKLRYKEGYFPIPPSDATYNIRSEMVALMVECGIKVECHHHEVATGGQAEIDMCYAPLTQMADQLTLYKYIIKNVAKRHRKTVTFMPKPLFSDNGSGMHCHILYGKVESPICRE
jgi:glutamine synthetase